MGRFHHDCSSHEEKSLSDRSRHLGAVAGEDQVYSNLGPEHAQATCFHGTIGVGWGSDLEAFDAATYPHILPDAIHGEVEGQGPQGQAYTTYLLRQNWRPRLRTVYTVCGTIDRRFKLSYSLARILVRKQALKGFIERASLIHERCQRMYGGVERFKAVVDCSPNFDVLLSG
jgi:hypothetical protein